MFIELGRTFHGLSSAADSDALDDQILFPLGNRSNWQDLLKEYRVVLLAEAGSGKTEEIRQIARKLRAENKTAFFIRLEHVSRNFETAFEEGSHDEFQRWMNSAEDGWLLLDSVDEARLRDPADFEAAVRLLGHLLVPVKQLAHIVITGRASAWRPKTDLALCVKHLGRAAPSISTRVTENEALPDDAAVMTTKVNRDEPIFKVVTLDNLGPTEVETFATAKGVTNVTAFLDAIERADAWSFTARPQDLEELVDFWIQRGQIGSRLELMRNSVDRRLCERDQTRADARPLSTEKARLGATLLASAATMAHEPRLRVPDGASNSKGLPITSVLSDWDNVDCSTLLGRPIFDEAIYGSVRFHHRTVKEYLTAEWFATLLQKHTSRQRIEALFFRDQYGLEVIAPVMRPVLPWLVILDEGIRDRVRRIAPEVFFEGGDPSQLPYETRRQILFDVCEQLASGESSRSMADYAAVQRFSDVDLTADIRTLIHRYKTDEDLLWFLLRMVWQGRLKEALPDAMAVALSASAGRSARAAAFHVMRALGSPEDNDEVRKVFLNESATLDRQLLAELIKNADSGPSRRMLDWLFACICKVEDRQQHTVDALSEEVISLVRQTETDLLPLIVEHIAALVDEPPVIERRHCDVSVRYAWLLNAAAVAVERLTRERHEAALQPHSLAILQKVPVFQQFEPSELAGARFEFSELVPRWPDLNLSLFWYLVAQARARLDEGKRERLTDWWSAHTWGSYVRFTSEDFAVILGEIPRRSFTDDKLVALSLAFSLYVQGGRKRGQRLMLKSTVRGHEELASRLSELMHPPALSAESKRHRATNARWQRRHRQRLDKEAKRREEWRTHVMANTEKLRNPGFEKPHLISTAQHYLHARMCEADSASSNRSKRNWRALEGEFGVEVAQAFRDGAVAYWRRNRPQLISEGAPSNVTYFSAILGLTGLAIEARETEGWLQAITEDEARLAFRYAMHELNGFPFWMPQLFAKFPDVVRRMALHEIEYELATEDQAKDSYYLLYDVSWSGEWLWDAIAPDLYQRVSDAEPKNLRNLEYMLSILQGSSIPNDRIAQLASSKANLLNEPDRAARWLAVWTGVNPTAAIPALEARLVAIADGETRTNFAMIYLAHLVGGRRRSASRVREEYRKPEYLKRLYLFMHDHIRHEEDIDRIGGGVYSPGLRDHAQDARDRLFELLKEMPGKNTFLALQEIARSHPQKKSRPWLSLQAKKRAEVDADHEPWSIGQFREFHSEQERTPSNHRQLFELALMRLTDLKHDLEHGDTSIAATLQRVKGELELRNFIANSCRQTAHGRYSVPQEDELADAMRPDLRFYGTGFDAPVPVELKLADNWSGPQLFERLESQLCCGYLRDNRSRRGIFLLVRTGKQLTWELRDGSSVAFDPLVQALQDSWCQISDRYPNIDQVAVIGIDLTRRASNGRT